jgi:hypothetical protein
MKGAGSNGVIQSATRQRCSRIAAGNVLGLVCQVWRYQQMRTSLAVAR